MSATHTVQSGECLSSIAESYGFPGWEKIYHHADNKDLRDLRPDPNLLYPGDKIIIPDPEPAAESGCGTESKHRFRHKKEKTWLRLDLLEDFKGTSLAGKFELSVDDGESIEGDLESGKLDIPIPATAISAKLTIYSPDDLILNRYDLTFGELDPIEEIEGLQARLRNLKFDPGEVDGVCGPRTEQAIKSFQLALEIEDDEEPYGSKTIEKLKELSP